ncbi:nitroreductase family protein [Oxobacter pfennigii]|uniref:Nitroreductase family protein n=1 Tax=Oxobacter pfennigii TaxID=36849 RepID=A0A0P8WRK4_9CLOT|nr:nitroreductase family protein [Oxobacter pfennigii]KPU45228.1 nitroreductase family protein [Oxobacter pfennigii]
MKYNFDEIIDRQGTNALMRMDFVTTFFMQTIQCIFYSAVPYRSEWRYGTDAHKVMLIDVGHVVQNLYLSSHAIGCGTCAVAAFDQAKADRLL